WRANTEARRWLGSQFDKLSLYCRISYVRHRRGTSAMDKSGKLNVVSNVVSLEKKDDERAKKIAQLRQLFDPNYKPNFRVGDIIQFRPHIAAMYDSDAKTVLYI